MECEVPRNVISALASGDPKQVFETCVLHYNPEVLAMATDDPYHGAPVMGFCPRINGSVALMNGFCVSYFDKDANGPSTHYVGLDDLLKIGHTCMSPALAMGFRLADQSGEATERAMKQMNTVRVMLQECGAQ